MFREHDGKLSFSRIVSFILICFYMISAMVVMWKSGFHNIPDIPLQLAGMITLLYVGNKGADAFKNRGGKL